MKKTCLALSLFAGSWIASAATPTASAAGASCTFNIYGTDSMMYMDAATGGKKVDKITIPTACKTSFSVHLHHAGTLPLAAMGHNWLLVEAANLTTVSQEAMAAGPANKYLPKDPKHILAGSKLLLGGGAGEPKEEIITFDPSLLKKGTAYTFFCSFPGHFAMMQGKVELQ